MAVGRMADSQTSNEWWSLEAAVKISMPSLAFLVFNRDSIRERRSKQPLSIDLREKGVAESPETEEPRLTLLWHNPVCYDARTTHHAT